MPRYYEDKPEGGACAGVKEDLGACLLRSDCVLKEGKSPRQCLKEGNCKALKYSFFECKRSMEKPSVQDIHDPGGHTKNLSMFAVSSDPGSWMPDQDSEEEKDIDAIMFKPR
ncbi:cytochrome c oxidase assembly factor 5 isoform X1 [Equus przewalskii]|uniref:Cytochrome c oxidase assembly factor 5 n=2 Tax=Equus TaxID=9789 RepID=A0A9L0K7F0_EQUAS|nr:PREDICTED: cytochrome c oxidase assembly factor 5 isoform X1 [Equus przewalskii]XP_008530508.1 PREDICTED: cytochrome c oxidase assembly factor 5 isoform X1 [Equus przewalskii]XP_023474377.1 cytochrome c oxidase assembly factor 5 isoform X1 [Equus caballus]XP_044628889.1 cytochrome c oxidase assembly factor 5 isoform X1 [Equus asinus]